MSYRIKGFDIARAYAIFGMYIVNFNFCFGSFAHTSGFGRFLELYVGNSTAIFIICAGMGLALMTGRAQYSDEEKRRLRSVVLRRSWFLLVAGLCLFVWWPGDILHFYGGYMHIAAFMLFVPKRFYMWAAAAAIIFYHVLLLLIPVETGWDLTKFQPVDFWTPVGFVRNTLYNGWNSMFPWIAYFMTGMCLGRGNLASKTLQAKVFFAGLALFCTFEGLRLFAREGYFSDAATRYIMSEYFPPYVPFMAITTGFALMAIMAFLAFGERFGNTRAASWLAATGRMTLTHYIVHLTLGMILLAWLTGMPYTGNVQAGTPLGAEYVFGFAAGFFIVSAAFSASWAKRFRHGPFEGLMRRFSDGSLRPDESWKTGSRQGY